MKEIQMIIKSIRESRGISQGELARLTGVSQSAISDIENNKRNPSLLTITLIAEALQLPVDALMQSKLDETK